MQRRTLTEWQSFGREMSLGTPSSSPTGQYTSGHFLPKSSPSRTLCSLSPYLVIPFRLILFSSSYSPLLASSQLSLSLHTLHYSQLLESTCCIANVFKREGVKKGDRVAIYMPASPLLAATMLACARIGAIHRYVYGCPCLHFQLTTNYLHVYVYTNRHSFTESQNTLMHSALAFTLSILL